MAWTSPKTFTSAVLSSTEMNTHLRDNLLHLASTTGNLTLSTTGPHAIGTAPLGNAQLTLGGSYNAGATADVSTGLYVNTIITVAANEIGTVAYVGGQLIEASSGTHELFAGLYVNAPVLTGAAATLTAAVSVCIAGVPTGATNTRRAPDRRPGR